MSEFANIVGVEHWSTADYETVEDAVEARDDLEEAMSILRGYRRGIDERIVELEDAEDDEDDTDD